MDVMSVTDYFQRLRDPEEGVNSFIISDLIKELSSRPMEACIKASETLIQEAVKNSAKDESSHLLLAETISVWSPVQENSYRKSLCIKTGEVRFALFLHLENEPSYHDSIMDEILSQKGILPSVRPSEPGAPSGIQLYRFWPDTIPQMVDKLSGNPASLARYLSGHATGHSRPSLAAVTEADTKGNYSPALCFSQAISLPPYGGGQWMEGHTSAGGEAYSALTHFFPAFEKAIRALGQEAVLDDECRAVAARCFRQPSYKGLSQYQASRELAAALRMEDGGWFGEHSRSALKILDTLSMDNALPKLRGELQTIRQGLEEHGHTNRDQAYVCNDLDNHTWLVPSSRDGLSMMVFEDQNRVMLVGIEPGGAPGEEVVTVLDTFEGVSFDSPVPAGYEVENQASTLAERCPPGRPPRPQLAEAITALDAGVLHPGTLAQFSLSNGQARLLQPFDGHLDSIKAWNSLTSNVASVECCLEEDYNSSAPGMSV